MRSPSRPAPNTGTSPALVAAQKHDRSLGPLRYTLTRPTVLRCVRPLPSPWAFSTAPEGVAYYTDHRSHHAARSYCMSLGLADHMGMGASEVARECAGVGEAREGHVGIREALDLARGQDHLERVVGKADLLEPIGKVPLDLRRQRVRGGGREAEGVGPALAAPGAGGRRACVRACVRVRGPGRAHRAWPFGKW